LNAYHVLHFDETGGRILVGSHTVVADAERGDRYLNPVAQVFDLATPPATALRHTQDVEALAFGADGATLLAHLSDDRVCVWNLSHRTAACTGAGLVSSFGLTRDGRLLIAELANSRVREYPGGREIIPPRQLTTSQVAFSGDGRRFVRFFERFSRERGFERSVQVFDTAAGKELAAPTFAGVIPADAHLAIDRNGERIVYSVGSPREGMWLFDMRDKSVRGPFAPLSWPAISSNGERALTGTEDGLITVWDTNALRPITQIVDPTFLGPAALSPDGALAATVGRDQILRLWETRSGKLVGRFTNRGRYFPKPYQKIEFSPDGKMIATINGPVVELHPVRPRDLIATGCRLLPQDHDACAGLTRER
jgi:WD40 repeat protein